MYKIGILLPRSTYYTGIGFDIIQGFKKMLASQGQESIQVVTENIGFGSDKQVCYKAAENMIINEDASVVFAYIGHRTAQLLRPLFLAANKLLIVLDSGANLPQESAVNSHIFYHSLHNALGNWLAAQNAVKSGYKTGGMVTGYYDGGYLHTVGAFNGFQQAGGTISFNHATNYKQEEFDVSPVKQHLENYPDSALLSLFSGDFVQWYFEALRTLEIGGKATVFLPPFGLEESMLENAVYPEMTVKGVAAWSKHLQNEENKQFIQQIEETGREATLFTLLGWEAAQIALELQPLFTEHKNNISLISNALKEITFQSPRGPVSFHKATNTSVTNMYEVTVSPSKTGNCTLTIDKTIEVPVIKAAFGKLHEQPIEVTLSGWFNSYTCI